MGLDKHVVTKPFLPPEESSISDSLALKFSLMLPDSADLSHTFCCPSFLTAGLAAEDRTG